MPLPNPCRNGGTCIQTLTGRHCECDPGYICTNCETEERRYRVSISTATSPPDARSDASVYLTMIGTKGQCALPELLDSAVDDMELGRTDHHYIRCGAAIGALRTLQFHMMGNDRWDFTTVTVESSQGVKTYNCNLSLTNSQTANCNVP